MQKYRNVLDSKGIHKLWKHFAIYSTVFKGTCPDKGLVYYGVIDIRVGSTRADLWHYYIVTKSSYPQQSLPNFWLHGWVYQVEAVTECPSLRVKFCGVWIPNRVIENKCINRMSPLFCCVCILTLFVRWCHHNGDDICEGITCTFIILLYF